MIGTSRIISAGIDRDDRSVAIIQISDSNDRSVAIIQISDSNDRSVVAIGIVDIGYAGNMTLGIRHHRTACITGISLFGMGCGVVFIVGERLRAS